MNSYIVLSAMGPDRPGLVDEISSFLSDRKINIEDSRMAVLGGEFAIILLASGDKDIIENFRQDINNIEKTTNFKIMVKTTIDPKKRSIKPSIPHKLTATSMDHPGIVHEITRILHNYSINIESLDTHITNAPVSGAPIFNMRCTVNIPEDEKLSSIKKELKKIGDSLNIDIDLAAMETF